MSLSRGEKELEAMEEELKKLREREDIIDQTWQVEVEMYERGIKQDHNLKQINPRIFPYHNQCILLMDMYAALDGPFEYNLDLDIGALMEQQSNGKRYLTDENNEFARVDEYLPCSSYSLLRTFLPYHRSKCFNIIERTAGSFIFLKSWEQHLLLEKDAWINECYKFPTYEEAKQSQETKDDAESNEDRPKIDDIPKGLRTKVLLKLLKHSISELQRDHRLAQAVMFSMIENKCFEGDEGVEAMRYFLLTVHSEYIYECGGSCHELFLMDRNILDEDDNMSDGDSEFPRPTHYCTDYKHFIETIKLTILNGIEYMTASHADMLVAYVQYLCEGSGWKKVEHMIDLIGYDEEASINHNNDKPHTLINAVITGLGLKALEGRNRLKTLLRWKYSTSGCVTSAVSKEIEAVSQSHLLSVDALVRIGKIQLMSFPADPLTEILGSRLVRHLLLNSIDLLPHSQFHGHLACPEDSCSLNVFIGDRFPENISITNEYRYADGLTNEFKAKNQRLMDIEKSFLENCNMDEVVEDSVIKKIFLSGPSQELQNVIKGLFLSQLVDTEYAGCGYGDFLVWCRLPIHIYEPMLYEHIANYPKYYDNESDSDEENEKKMIYYDEDGNNLEGDRLKARYDFSLLLMKKKWAEPWKPESHFSFQVPFREAVYTLLLCAHRYLLGSDIPVKVCSFLPREWWPDERQLCWRYECEIENIANLIFKHEDRRSKSLVACSDCMTAYACSKKHLSLIHRDGHRRVCRHPPIRYFNHEDALFCQDVMGKNSNFDTSSNRMETMNQHGNEEEDDDASCWESIGSEELESDSKTEQIYRYFESKAYRMHKMDEPAFLAFYSDN